MTIDIKTMKVEPRRGTFSHIARRYGVDKPASRYDEATYDVQATENFHYKPLWGSQFWHYDQGRTVIKMADWYAFRDPRQYYYATYNIARASQIQATEKNFDFVEKRGMLEGLDPAWRETIEFYLLPLRHAEWGANMNSSSLCEKGYGTAITAPCIFSAGDHLAMAQIIGRIGLLFDGSSGTSLERAKLRWMTAPEWQDIRRLVEDTLVIEDWFELFVAQNLVIDGLTHPLVYGRFDAAGRAKGAAGVTMLCEFMSEWFPEHSRWADAMVKIAAAESADNKAHLSGWCAAWTQRVAAAFTPLAVKVLGEEAGAAAIADGVKILQTRAAALGLAV